MYVCLCKSITEDELAACWAAVGFDLKRLVERLDLNGEDCCGHCVENIDYLVDAAESYAASLIKRAADARAQVPNFPKASAAGREPAARCAT